MSAHLPDDVRTKLHMVLLAHLPEASPPLPADTQLSDLGLSSVSVVNIVLDLEAAFEVERPDAALNVANFQTIGTLEAAFLPLLTTGAGR